MCGVILKMGVSIQGYVRNKCPSMSHFTIFLTFNCLLIYLKNIGSFMIYNGIWFLCKEYIVLFSSILFCFFTCLRKLQSSQTTIKDLSTMDMTILHKEKLILFRILFLKKQSCSYLFILHLIDTSMWIFYLTTLNICTEKYLSIVKE